MVVDTSACPGRAARCGCRSPPAAGALRSRGDRPAVCPAGRCRLRSRPAARRKSRKGSSDPDSRTDQLCTRQILIWRSGGGRPQCGAFTLVLGSTFEKHYACMAMQSLSCGFFWLNGIDRSRILDLRTNAEHTGGYSAKSRVRRAKRLMIIQVNPQCGPNPCGQSSVCP